MGLIDAGKIKKFWLGTDDEYIADDYYDDEDEVEDNQRQEEPVRPKKQYSEKQQYMESNVVSIPNSNHKERVVISYPKDVERDAPQIIDYLRSNVTCVINLEDVPTDESQRIADHICGAAYALFCEIQRISGEIFIVAPAHVGVSNEIKEEIKNSDTSFWQWGKTSSK